MNQFSKPILALIFSLCTSTFAVADTKMLFRNSSSVGINQISASASSGGEEIEILVGAYIHAQDSDYLTVELKASEGCVYDVYLLVDNKYVEFKHINLCTVTQMEYTKENTLTVIYKAHN